MPENDGFFAGGFPGYGQPNWDGADSPSGRSDETIREEIAEANKRVARREQNRRLYGIEWGDLLNWESEVTESVSLYVGNMNATEAMRRTADRAWEGSELLQSCADLLRDATEASPPLSPENLERIRAVADNGRAIAVGVLENFANDTWPLPEQQIAAAHAAIDALRKEFGIPRYGEAPENAKREEPSPGDEGEDVMY